MNTFNTSKSAIKALFISLFAFGVFGGSAASQSYGPEGPGLGLQLVIGAQGVGSWHRQDFVTGSECLNARVDD